MDELRKYVDSLFARYKMTGEVAELKEEILGNLEARVADYLGEGMTSSEAVALAKSNLGSIEFLIPHQRPVYVNRYRLELLQTALLYTVIAWILTIPLRLTFPGALVNTLLLLAAVGLGIAYLLLSSRKDEGYLSATAPLDQNRLGRHSRTAWLLWVLFVAVTAALTTAKQFGSEIWFGRPLHLDGPHRFAQIAVFYALPVVTIVLPLLYSKARTLTEKYEVEIK